jgi:predicted metal-dependent peptidase
MEAGFTYLDEQGIEPDVFVCLTDGYTDFHEANAPAYDVVWCISTDVVPSYGVHIPFTME